MTSLPIKNGFAIIALITSAATYPTLAATPSIQNDIEKRNETIVRDAFNNWTSGGNVFEILSKDVVWMIAGSGPVAGTYRGLDDFINRGSRPLLDRLAGPITPRVHHLWAIDDRVIIRFDGSATTTSGAPYNNQFVWIFRMDNEEVVEAEAFLDLNAYQTVVDNNEPKQQ